MLIHAKVRECDITGQKYDQLVDGAAALCRGATGRWCEVLWVGPEYLAQEGNAERVISRGEAALLVEKMPGVNFVDF